MMLRHLGWSEAADLTIRDTDGAIHSKTVTYDFERLLNLFITFKVIHLLLKG